MKEGFEGQDNSKSRKKKKESQLGLWLKFLEGV